MLASPAAAAIDADFNGDGVLDRVVLPHPSQTHIEVRVSGAAPQILKIYDRIVAVVATDIDHDGAIDLSALSERRGVFVWLNKGKAGRGHLKAIQRKHHPGGFSLSTRGPLASAPEPSPDGPAATGTQDDRSALYERITHDLGHRPAVDLLSASVPSLPDDRGGVSGSRAPPTTR